ncbi:hypothetical protein [Deferrisoma camini]|uniref:hypothetical protein n=1 Tax=Deferrisoma camini TaxID=1035120 RepID=UPI00046D270D|nr:hypothetical protein [Deferrisoma camini]
MGIGYFPNRYFPSGYWADRYWPDYGLRRYAPSWREMDRANYVALATLRPSRWVWRRDRLELVLEERKRAWDVDYPLGTYRLGTADDPSNHTWAGLDPDADGRPVPVIIGRCYDVPAVRIGRDEGAGTVTYHLATHALSAVTAVYVDGRPQAPSSVDLAAATVTMDEATVLVTGASGYETWARVTADVVGVADSNSHPILNPADAVEYVLRDAGAQDADLLIPASAGDPQAGRGFGAYGARLAWVVGTDPEDGIEGHAPEVSWYLAKRRPLLDHVEELLGQIGGLLYTDGQGRLVLRPWALLTGEGVLELTDADVDRAERERRPRDVVTRVVARYRRRHAADAWQSYVEDRPAAQYRRGLPAPAIAEVDLHMDRLADAQAYASRRLAMDDEPHTVWTVDAGARAMLLEPGDAVRLVLSRPSVSELLEVAEVERDLGAHRVRLVLVDRRGFGPRGAWWSEDNPVFPARLGGGPAAPWDPNWTAEQKAWARENLGYWSDDDGYTAPGDADSLNESVWS